MEALVEAVVEVAVDGEVAPCVEEECVAVDSTVVGFGDVDTEEVVVGLSLGFVVGPGVEDCVVSCVGP